MKNVQQANTRGKPLELDELTGVDEGDSPVPFWLSSPPQILFHLIIQAV